ncbi:MAG: YceD family protein [Pseudorhodobacter sp.]
MRKNTDTDPKGFVFPAPLRVSALPQRKPYRFDLAPDAHARAALAADLGITTLAALHFAGEIRASGKTDFRLEASLEARAEQPSALTLAPVETKIREKVLRQYIHDMTWPEAEEAEMPDDDSAEPLPEEIDLRAVLLESLALALPDYPRTPGETLEDAVFGPEGSAPLRDEDLRPFSGLAALRDRLSKADLAATTEDDEDNPPETEG